jgi:hypothetical protein
MQAEGNKIYRRQILQERLIWLHTAQYNKMFKYFAITLEAFDIV